MSVTEHLYVHVPFCVGKTCAYCALYSVPYDPVLADRFIAALTRELEPDRADNDVPNVTTIYVGGGTPSALDASRLRRLLKAVQTRVDGRAVREWTVELNPGTVTPATLRVLSAAGVNRLSLGVQSLDDRVLRAMGRRHTVQDVATAVDAAHRAGFTNVGLDLIAGLPGVTPAAWHATLSGALNLDPSHLAVYALTLEAGTPLADRIRNGRLSCPDDAAHLRALAHAEAHLEHAGYVHYEISNYARPGFECRHNVSCWRGEDYLGFGPGAASRSGRRRWTNTADLAAYLCSLERGEAPPRSTEQLDRTTDAAERLAFAFRLAEGVDLERFVSRHAVDEPLARGWCAALGALEEEGLVVCKNMHWKLTGRGRTFADYVAAALLHTSATVV